MIKLAALILILALGVVSAFLIWRLHKSKKKVKRLEESNNKLTEELRKRTDTQLKAALSGLERIMISKALTCPQFKDRIEEPKTQHFVRVGYKDLKKKIKESIRE